MIALWLIGALFTLGVLKDDFLLPNKAESILLFAYACFICIFAWPLVLGVVVRNVIDHE